VDIPVTSLRPILEETREDWQANLEELYRDAFFILGKQVRSFEQEFAAAMGARFAVGCGSGSDAIELLLRDAGVTRREQRVLTSALTAPFTGIAILSAGATPTFADIDPETLLIDPRDAAQRIDPGVAVLLPVHLYGQPCRIDHFAELARANGKLLLQDACQAHGAWFCGDTPFTHFSAAAYSFYPTKNLGALGDGGAILTDSEEQLERLRLLRDGGRKGNQISSIPGINSRLDEVQACYLRAFLPHLDEWNAERAMYASQYIEGLSGLEAIRIPRREPCCVYHLFVVRAERRDELRDYLLSRGIGTGIHYPVPLHVQPAFVGAGLREGDLPHAEQACREIVSLPLWPGLGEASVARVIETIRDFYS
jgi:dTDP-3-amino-3,4,6-trideoxy-alpha-D-glucose transaminase